MIDSTFLQSNVLIVDDQQSNIDVLKGLLNHEGYTNYFSTTDSRMVVPLFKEFKPDILLLDLNMPYMNGFEVMKQLKTLIKPNAYFPILVLTADINAESKLMALASGASDFITKPFDLIEVDLRIKNLLKVGYLYQQLENQNQVLDDAVKNRTIELEKSNHDLSTALEKAKEMNRLKTNFLANMSHELRTPIIGINGFAELLRAEIADPELKEMAENIFKSGSRLAITLNLILDLSMLESERVVFDIKEIDLASEISVAFRRFFEAANKKGLSLKSTFSHAGIILETDEMAFQSILNNLIGNAVKFTYEGFVAVDISRKSDYIEIKVTDTGIGISKEFHNIIFEEFRQVSEGLNRNFEGTGLGLNITKKLVERLSGSISVESELGKGSTFVVKLPFRIRENNPE
ncbi:MAG: response regulator [Ignavibacteriales bacterium]|nr:response regulator [Ignavibacteriales bacterium]